MADKSYKLTLSLSDGSTINAGTITAPQGPNGANGVTFTPSVSEAGVLSWTNDGGLANPDPVNIKGDAAVITESDVAGWGFTKNVGTITEIKMNGSSKGTSGVVDLGTVLTEHQSLENYVTLDGIQNITGKKTVIPPANKDNSNQIATTAWAGRRYKSIADFGFTSQTTVKAIVQKIIDNWYEYCTFACTNDNFNNFSDTPDGYGTLIIEVGSNALRPLISFTKQIGDSNSYKHWQANIVRSGNQVTEIQWCELALKTDISTNYVTTDTTQAISGKKTVVTPPNTDDSTQIANTTWVRENYQATCYAGRDSGETDTRYFKVASYSTVADYDHVTLVAHLQDIDSPVFSTVNVHCSTSTKANAPNAYIGVIDNFTHDASSNPFNYYKDRLFVVANYTIGTQGVTFELWLKTTGKYQQTIFKVISQSSRKGTSKKRPWTLYNNVTTESGTTDFSETSSDGRLVVNNNYPYGATVGYLQPQTDGNIPLGSKSKRFGYGYFKGSCRIYHDSGSVPDISMINTGLINGTNPSSIAAVQIIGRDEKNVALTGWRGWVSKEGYTSSHLYARSFNTDYANYVALYSKPNAPAYDETSTETKNSTGSNSPDIWYFAPATKNNVDLGASNQRWNNGYITNLQLCKVINGGGGNSMIQQNSNTDGADIIVGSTKCALKIIGKYGRPEYRQGKNGTYVNLALHSDIKNGTLTILKNGGSLGSFSANQSSDVDIDIDVPENLSELTNDIKVLRNNTDKSHSLSIAGTNDLDSAATDTYCIAIGPAAMARYTKTIKIGTGLTPSNQSVTQIGTTSYTSSGRALYLGAGNTGFTYMNAAGSSWTSASDIRDKTDIKNIDHALDFIKKLKPITYVMNDRERYLIRDENDNPILDDNGKQQYDVEAHKRGDKKKHRRFAGLSAQDTYQAMLDCYNNDTNYAQIVDNNKFDHPDDEYLEQYSMSYERLVPFLIKAVQEQQAQIDALKIKIAS